MSLKLEVYNNCVITPLSHRAVFKLGAKKIIVLCLLVKKISAVYSVDRCNFKESKKAAWDLNWIGGQRTQF